MSAPNRIIINGKVADQEPLRQSIRSFRTLGEEIEVRVTWEDGDAAMFAREACEQGIQTIVAAGGDGTLNEVVNGVMSAPDPTATSIGLLPLGTANDFARGIGAPIDNIPEALDQALHQSPQLIDVGKLNDRYFINLVSGGFGAEVTSSTPAQMKNLLGGVAYSLMGLITAIRAVSWHTSIQADDEDFDMTIMLAAICNGKFAGGGYEMVPHASLNNGLLELLLIKEAEISEVPQVMSEMEDGYQGEKHFVHHRSVSELRIQSDQKMQFNLDGEAIRGTDFIFTVIPNAIHFRMPSSCPLLTGSNEA